MGGFLSVVISAMAVWMDLREEAVDNSWVLFSIMAGFLLQLLEKGPKGEIRPYYRKGMKHPENFHFTVPIFLSALLYAGGVY